MTAPPRGLCLGVVFRLEAEDFRGSSLEREVQGRGQGKVFSRSNAGSVLISAWTWLER